VLDCLVGSVLANIFAWEDEAIVVGSVEWHCVMAIVNHWKSELFEIADESSEDLSAWHVKRRLVVVFYRQKD
jgi:hypothetical protein